MYRDDQGRTITITNELARGGEGRICNTREHPGLVAKLLDKPSHEAGDKLNAMLANPCREGTAWPQRAITDYRGRHCGHLMPRVTNARQLSPLYNPKQRLTTARFFHYEYLIITAANIAATTGGLHDHKYVVGDVADANILVQPTAIVTFIDNDSYQVPRPYQRGYYRCGVGTDEYTPPELIGVDFPSIDRAPHHDNFGMAVIIFRLLMEGCHPYAARYHGSGEPPKLLEKIKAGSWAYSTNALLTPPPTAPPFTILPTNIQTLFRRCFIDGHHNPSARPSPKEWLHHLIQFRNSLTTCSHNHNHKYSNHLWSCPWCERARQFGIDTFPNQASTHYAQPTLCQTTTTPTRVDSIIPFRDSASHLQDCRALRRTAIRLVQHVNMSPSSRLLAQQILNETNQQLGLDTNDTSRLTMFDTVTISRYPKPPRTTQPIVRQRNEQPT